jgi:cation diffusion facilitator family transporter
LTRGLLLVTEPVMADEKTSVALGSIVASAGLTVAKAIVGLATGSLAILSEAGHSLIDLAATVMTYFAVQISGKPADEEHHYGHGKIESVSALAETALLFVLSGVVIWAALQRLLGDQGHTVEPTRWAFLIIVGSIVVDFLRARVLYRVAKKTASEALEADALHFSSDMWSSIAVLIGLAAVAFGYPWADSAAALIVASFVCLAGWRLGIRTLNTLTDTAPAGVADRIMATVKRVKGVVSVEHVRVRTVGATLFVDLSVAVSRTLPLDRVAILRMEIVAAIGEIMPNAEINVAVSPLALDDETVLERVMVIARNMGLAVHHVTVQAVAGRLSVSLDLEVDGNLPLARAHDIASSLETAIRDELGPSVEVDTHIEPLQLLGVAGRDAPAARVAAIQAELSQVARKLGFVREVHDVRVRETKDGEIVNFHCRVDPGLTVRDVHDRVDELERGLRRRFPEILRVIGHAEPKRG